MNHVLKMFAAMAMVFAMPVIAQEEVPAEAAEQVEQKVDEAKKPPCPQAAAEEKKGEEGMPAAGEEAPMEEQAPADMMEGAE